jgi:hypothetical protein
VADARQLVQILWVLPGESSFRRNCADVCVRFLGGDLTLVDEIFLNRQAQETLAREQPNHPARIFGEAVESDTLKRKREELELAKIDLEMERVLCETKRIRLNSFIEGFAAARPCGVDLDDRARLLIRDMVGSVARQTNVDEICIQSFLRSKGIDPRHAQSAFGRKAAGVKRAELREAGLPEVLPTKQIEVNGQVVTAYLYTAADLPVLERALDLYVNPTPARPAQTLASMWGSNSA